MKRILLSMSLCLGLGYIPSILAQDAWQDLVHRLTYYSPQSYKSAILDLQKQFPKTYQADADWEKTIQELEANRQALIEGLNKQDKGAGHYVRSNNYRTDHKDENEKCTSGN